jgi:hypothetical protein
MPTKANAIAIEPEEALETIREMTVQRMTVRTHVCTKVKE